MQREHAWRDKTCLLGLPSNPSAWLESTFESLGKRLSENNCCTTGVFRAGVKCVGTKAGSSAAPLGEHGLERRWGGMDGVEQKYRR